LRVKSALDKSDGGLLSLSEHLGPGKQCVDAKPHVRPNGPGRGKADTSRVC